ncbi:MAG: glycoside hydrolase family 16 protein [Prevotella sp.]|nr:glycoside hydrolase family 16 protein [Prevotella sp.]
MYRNLLCLLMLVAFVGDIPLAMAQSQDEEWQLVFSDEFNQPNGSQPDKTKWNRHQRGSSRWSRWISDVDDVVYIKKGRLICRAVPNKIAPSDTAKMLTGAINTKGKFTFKYGKVEVRMRTNLQRGNFPAAWMFPSPQDKRPYAEIDIVESFGTRSEATHTAHTQFTQDNKKHGEKNSFRIPLDVTKWHVYSVEWDENHIVWMIDGKVSGIYEKSTNVEKISKKQWTFDQPFYLILNQSVGDGNYEFMIPQTSKVYETQFDWIRVYQKKFQIQEHL